MNDPILSFLGIVQKSGNIVFGMNAVKDKCKRGSVKLVLTASDISQNSFDKIDSFLKQRSEIKFERLNYSKSDIEFVIKKFPAVMAILDECMAQKIITLIDENKFKFDTDTENFERNDAYNDKI